LRAAAGCGEVPRVPDVPVPDDAAGLRAANTRLRELLAERDARIEDLLDRLAAVGDQVAGLQAQVADLAAKAGSEAADACLGGSSFTPTTKVLLASGAAVPIATLKVGDKVLATNTKTGKTQPEAVAAVLQHYDTNLYNLTVETAHGNTSVIHTTANHLFWASDLKQWIPAAKPKKGERLKTADGSVAVAWGGAAPVQHDGWMWDLTVPGSNDHDFYVVTFVAVQVAVPSLLEFRSWSITALWGVKTVQMDGQSRPWTTVKRAQKAFRIK
jgi:hypothetical protein